MACTSRGGRYAPCGQIFGFPAAGAAGVGKQKTKKGKHNIASKPVIHYAVHSGINPKTREAIKLPRIVNQPILSQDDIVDRAIDT